MAERGVRHGQVPVEYYRLCESSIGVMVADPVCITELPVQGMGGE